VAVRLDLWRRRLTQIYSNGYSSDEWTTLRVLASIYKSNRLRNGRMDKVVNNMRANVDVIPYDDHDRAVKILHSLDCTIWGGKFEAIVNSEKYDTLIFHLLQEEFLSAPIHSPLSGSPYRSFKCYQSRFRSLLTLTSLRSKDFVLGTGFGSSTLRCQELPDVE
jgi:hypothetical protein